MTTTQWAATERVEGLVPAPGGLGFVQDLLNTCSDGLSERWHRYDELLGDLASARTWLAGAVSALAQHRGPLVAPRLAAADLEPLLALREQLRGLVAGGTTVDGLAGTAAVEVVPGPSLALRPTGDGWRWIASAALMECFLAQENGTWRRLKACRNPHCVATFYDHTRNNNGVWHSVRTCGNPANLRASRARRRAAEGIGS
jgi:hypothetical protein